jgi:hypothetical protein
MKRLTGWQDVKQQTLLVALFTFFNKHEAWNKLDFSDLNNLSSAQRKHSKPQIHAHCYPQSKLSKQQQWIHLLLGAQCRTDITRHNEQVKNWLILRRFTDAVLCG